MATLSRELIEKCKSKLVAAKAEILNRVRESRADLYNSEDGKGGDEGDQTLRALAESEFLSMHERLRNRPEIRASAPG